MLLQSQRIREEVWQRLHTIFLRYTGGSETISSQQLAAVVSEILREDSPRELDYVMLNLNRIDTDANGTIDFQ
jgi:Ca2+-binding EF-hand superfamily protein